MFVKKRIDNLIKDIYKAEAAGIIGLVTDVPRHAWDARVISFEPKTPMTESTVKTLIKYLNYVCDDILEAHVHPDKVLIMYKK